MAVVDTTRAPAKRFSIADQDEEILEQLEKEAEEEDLDEPLYAEEEEVQKQPVLTTRQRKELKAKASCPIRTRFKPEFEEQRKARDEPKKKRLMERRVSVSTVATVATIGTRATRKSTRSQLSKYSEPESDWELAYTNGSWDQYQAQMERRTTRGSLYSSVTRSSVGSSRLSKYSKYVNRAGADLKAVRDVAVRVSRHGLQDMTGEAAERGVCDLVGSMYHAEGEDLKAHGVTDSEMRRVARDRSFMMLKSGVSAEGVTTAYDELKEHGKFFNSNRSMSRMTLGADEVMMNELEKPRFQNVMRQGLSREEAMRMMHEGLDDEEEHAFNTFHKVAVSMQTVEDVWWSNCKGQAAIRRKPEEHEAVYDFADNRISMPKYLHGGRGGQLVTVKPDIDEENGKGEVLVYTRAPKRNFNKNPEKLAELGANVITREKGADGHHEYNHGLGGHGHLSKRNLPPSSKDWLDWRDLQQAKRKAAWDAAVAAGLAKRQSLKEAERKKHGGAGDEGEFDSQESDADEEAVASMSEHINTARSGSPRNVQSPGRSGRQPQSPGSSARPGAYTSPRSLASPGRSARKFATEALEIANIRWDFRPPPTPEERERLMRKVADRLHQEGHHGHHTTGPLSHVAQRHSQEDRNSTGKVDPFADEERECLWILREIGKQHQDPLDLIFAVPLEDDFVQPEEELDSEDASIEAEMLWRDIFQPIPKTMTEKFQGLFSMFHRN